MIRLPWRRTPPDASYESDAPRAGSVRGERTTVVASGARSLQSRMSSLIAAGLMIGVGAGILTWYYAEALSRPTATRKAAHLSVPEAAGEGMTLPSFASIVAQQPARPVASIQSSSSASAVVPSRISAAEQSLMATTLPSNSLLEPPVERAPGGLSRGYGALSQQPSRQQASDRRLAGDVFAIEGNSASSVDAAPARNTRAQIPAVGATANPLDALLNPAVLSATLAKELPTRRLLLPKGAFIDCTLETAIDSTLPGMTTCVTASDTFGADGTIVLLERGTKLVGETSGEVRQGEARLFVVWTEARTPSGVVIELDSPGTDALGRSGLEGKVNRHFWQRFGAAALVSMIDGAVQSGLQSSSRGGTVVLDPAASEDVLTEVLRSTVNIPPTIRVHNGAAIQVLVARDVDFRPVYDLEPR